MKCRNQNVNYNGVSYWSIEGGAHLDDVLELGGDWSMRIVTADGYVIDNDERIERVNTANERSISVLISNSGGLDFLITGDLIGQKASPRSREDARLEPALGAALKTRNIDVEVLQVGQHGAENATAASFIAAIAPEVAVISAGDGNTHNHPRCKTHTTLRQNNVPVIIQTQRGDPECGKLSEGTIVANGTILIRAKNDTYTIHNADESPTVRHASTPFQLACTKEECTRHE